MNIEHTQYTESQLQELLAMYQQLKSDRPLELNCLVGKEGGRITYAAKVPVPQLLHHFKLVPALGHNGAGIRLQRELTKARESGISSYIQENDLYLFPQLVAIVEDLKTQPTDLESVVKLTIDANLFRYLTDGQGRYRGFELACEANSKDLSQDYVDLKIVKSLGLDHDMQVFCDLNSSFSKPNKSIITAMDHRSALNTVVKNTVNNIEWLSPLIDFTKASVTNKSKLEQGDCIWTLNQVVEFFKLTTGTTNLSADKLLIDTDKQAIWLDFVSTFFGYWRLNKQFNGLFGDLDSLNQTKNKTILTTSVCLKALGYVAKVFALYRINGAEWGDLVQNVNRVDFSVSNPEYVGRCLTLRGKFEDKAFNRKAVAAYIITQLGLELPDELKNVDAELTELRKNAGNVKTYVT